MAFPHWINKCRSFETNTIEEMEDKLNAFMNDKFIIASPLFFVHNSWFCMVYYKVPPLNSLDEQINPKNSEKHFAKEKNGLASGKQIKYLLMLGYTGDTDKLTVTEANRLIKELKEKK